MIRFSYTVSFRLTLILLFFIFVMAITNRVYGMDPVTKNYQPKILKIVNFGNSILYKKTRYIDNISDEILQISQDMIKTLENSGNGVGLAAPQVNLSIKMFVYRTDLEHSIQTVINPRIEIIDNKKENDWEGCLSLPNLVGLVPRYKKIRVIYQNVEGEKISKIMHGFEARIFQHETDHLNGVVYVQKIENFAKFGFPEELHLLHSSN